MTNFYNDHIIACCSGSKMPPKTGSMGMWWDKGAIEIRKSWRDADHELNSFNHLRPGAYATEKAVGKIIEALLGTLHASAIRPELRKEWCRIVQDRLEEAFEAEAPFMRYVISQVDSARRERDEAKRNEAILREQRAKLRDDVTALTSLANDRADEIRKLVRQKSVNPVFIG